MARSRKSVNTYGSSYPHLSMRSIRRDLDPLEPGIVEVLGYSPIFGFYREGKAKIIGTFGEPPVPSRVIFHGEKVERERFVFMSLNSLSDEQLRALSMLVEIGPCRPLDR